MLFAQDVIVKKSGDEFKTKVLEVNQSIVTYKMFDNQEGPVYNMNKDEILMIKYQDGTKDIFNQETSVLQPSVQPITSGKIRIVENVFYFNGVKQNDISVINLMKANGDNQSAWAYKKGWNMQKAGTPLIAVGIPALIAGILIASVSSSNTKTTYTNGIAHTTTSNDRSTAIAGSVTTLVGIASTVVGVVFKVHGKKKKALAAGAYNKKFE